MRHGQQLQGAIYLLLLSFLGALLSIPVAAQDIEVTSADPSSAEQETTGLLVSISGNGFDKGAKVAFYVTGTVDPGGIAVGRVTFRGPKRLEATIDVAAEATVADFDIEVTSNGRRGRGTELFRVVEKGSGTSGEASNLTIELADALDHNLASDGAGTGHPNCELDAGCYVHGEDKARVWTGGMVQPNPPGLAMDTNHGGKVGSGRKMRVDLGGCVDLNDQYPTCADLPAELLGVIGPDAYFRVRPYGWWDAIPLLPVGQPTPMALRVVFYVKRTPHNERWVIEVASGPFGSIPGSVCPRTEPGSSFDELAADVTVTAVDVDFDGAVDGWTVWTGGGQEPASVPVLICKVGKKADEVVDVGTATLRFAMTALLIE